MGHHLGVETRQQVANLAEQRQQRRPQALKVAMRQGQRLAQAQSPRSRSKLRCGVLDIAGGERQGRRRPAPDGRLGPGGVGPCCCGRPQHGLLAGCGREEERAEAVERRQERLCGPLGTPLTLWDDRRKGADHGTGGEAVKRAAVDITSAADAQRSNAAATQTPLLHSPLVIAAKCSLGLISGHAVTFALHGCMQLPVELRRSGMAVRFKAGDWVRKEKGVIVCCKSRERWLRNEMEEGHERALSAENWRANKGPCGGGGAGLGRLS